LWQRGARGAHWPLIPEHAGRSGQAYAIQDAALALDGRQVVGWKVGRINPPDDARLASNRLAGPIFADSVVMPGAGQVPAMPVFAQGFAAAEAEFLLHVAPVGPACPQDDAATLALLDAVHIGIEIASSPYPGINDDGPPVTVSDYGNNYGLVVGAPLAGWQSVDFASIAVTWRSMARWRAGHDATMLDGPLGAVRFLLGNLAARGIDAGAGLWVSTGAVTGVHPVRPGQQVRATFTGGDGGTMGCTISR
jgi:2-keto-4-pentenoate hydratase